MSKLELNIASKAELLAAFETLGKDASHAYYDLSLEKIGSQRTVKGVKLISKEALAEITAENFEGFLKLQEQVDATYSELAYKPIMQHLERANEFAVRFEFCDGISFKKEPISASDTSINERIYEALRDIAEVNIPDDLNHVEMLLHINRFIVSALHEPVTKAFEAQQKDMTSLTESINAGELSLAEGNCSFKFRTINSQQALILYGELIEDYVKKLAAPAGEDVSLEDLGYKIQITYISIEGRSFFPLFFTIFRTRFLSDSVSFESYNGMLLSPSIMKHLVLNAGLKTHLIDLNSFFIMNEIKKDAAENDFTIDQKIAPVISSDIKTQFIDFLNILKKV